MKKVNKYFLLISVILISLVSSCDTPSSESYIPLTNANINVDLTKVPYQKLSEYNFFSGNIKNLTPADGVISYKPASELFTDYAKKKRFLWIPQGLKANYVSDSSVLDVPVGSVLIKNFYYDNVQPDNKTVIVETRIMIRKSSGWIFAEYVWNDDQTEAFLQTVGSNKQISWKNESNEIKTVNYKIPSTTLDCKRCHGNIFNNQFSPIGIKPQNLNHNLTYNNVSVNQLEKLVEVGYLNNNLPNQIESVINYNDLSMPLEKRVRSYFDSNCSHCHVNGGEGHQIQLRFSYSETTSPEKMGVGVTAHHQIVGYNGRIVYPGNFNQSILHYRVSTETDNFFIMPALGRSLKEEKAVKLVEDWINSL